MRSGATKVLAMLLALASLWAGTSARAAQPTLTVSSPVVLAGRYSPDGIVRAIYPSDDQAISAAVVWSADGEPIVGQTGSTLTLSPEYVGKLISAQITLHETGFADLVTNAVGEVVYGSGPSSGGSMGYGGESIALPGCFAPRSEVGDAPVIGWPLFFNCNPYNTDFASPASQTFAWYRDGSLIPGETKSEYRLTNADSGKVIWATFRAVWANGFVFTEAKRMAAPAPYKIIARKPSIRGVFRAKGKLTAVTQGWDSSANLSYQWFSNYFPIDGANTRTYRLRATDLDKNVQVLVTATRPGYNPVSRVSDPVSNSDVPELSAYSAYKKVFGSYQATTTNYDLNYIVSPTVTPDALAHEQTLLQQAADFWAPQFTPSGQTIVFLTKDDTTWAEALVAQHPNWSSGIPGGIRSWIENKNCGFALSFMDAQRQVFIQCVHLGTDHSLNDDSVSEHEYTHWFQYAQTPNLYSTVAPWLVEGQANFYGQALGIAPKDPELKYINNTLAGYATQWDIFNGYNFGDFRMLDILQAGDSFDTEILLDRFGMVWDEYYLGSLTSEWLIEHFGHAKYVQWTRDLLQNKTTNRDTEITVNAVAFRNAFGFDFAKLSTYLTPYLAARSAQVRTEWNDFHAVQVYSSPIGSTQALPTFSPAVITLNQVQRDWVANRTTDEALKSISCNAHVTASASKNDLLIAKARAQNACDFALNQNANRRQGLTATAAVLVTGNESESGQVFVSFNG